VGESNTVLAKYDDRLSSSTTGFLISDDRFAPGTTVLAGGVLDFRRMTTFLLGTTAVFPTPVSCHCGLTA
jgi:hypothetical protein